jgi:hypothetical protein
MTNEFDNLITVLRNNGYTVKVKKEKIYHFANVTGKGIRAGFCTPHDPNSIDSSYQCLNGKIAADHEDCFDKWRKCPLILSLPKNDAQMNYLLNQLEFWSSEEGYNLSNEYEHEKWVYEYPEEFK